MFTISNVHRNSGLNFCKENVAGTILNMVSLQSQFGERSFTNSEENKFKKKLQKVFVVWKRFIDLHPLWDTGEERETLEVLRYLKQLVRV